MRYSLLITCSPLSDNANHALKFAEALLEKGHVIMRVFFYGDGALLVHNSVVAAQDEVCIENAWQQFVKQNSIDSVVCIAAALKRGVLDTSEQNRHNKPSANLHEGHVISGLGQLIEATQSSDRLVSFK